MTVGRVKHMLHMETLGSRGEQCKKHAFLQKFDVAGTIIRASCGKKWPDQTLSVRHM
jgi:hypothetical protein